MSDRSLLTVVTDTFTARRYLHHLAKIATGALALAAYWLAFSRLGPFAGAVVGSVTWFLSLRIAYALDHGERVVKPDLWCDLSLHVLPVAIAFAWIDWRIAAGLGAVLVPVYVWTYPNATP